MDSIYEIRERALNSLILKVQNKIINIDNFIET